MAAMLHDVRRTRPRTVPLAMMTMKTQIHGSVNFLWVWGSALRPAGRWELR